MLKTLKSGISPGICGWKVSGKLFMPYFPYGKYPYEKTLYAVLFIFELVLYKINLKFRFFVTFRNQSGFPGFFQPENMEISFSDIFATGVFLILRNVAHCFQSYFQERLKTFHNGWIKCWKLIKVGVTLLKFSTYPRNAPWKSFPQSVKWGKPIRGKLSCFLEPSENGENFGI